MERAMDMDVEVDMDVNTCFSFSMPLGFNMPVIIDEYSGVLIFLGGACSSQFCPKVILKPFESCPLPHIPPPPSFPHINQITGTPSLSQKR